jgi:O-antigen ligase
VNAACVVLLSLALGYAALHDAGVEPNDWGVSLVAVGLCGILCWSRARSPWPRGWTTWLPLSLLAWACLALLPLPKALVRLLAPERAAALDGLSAIAGPWSWAALSAKPAATLEKVIGLAGCILVFWLMADLAGRLDDYPWAVAWPLLILAGFEAVLGLIQAYAPGGDRIATGTWVNRNHYCGFLELCLPFALAYGVAVLGRGRSRHGVSLRMALAACGLFTIAALILLAILHSFSRMGFVAALVSMFIMGAAALGSGEAPAWRRRLGPALIGLLVLLAFIFLPPDKLIERFGHMAATEEISADVRIQIWRDTLELVRAQPVAGSGLGAYESALMRHKLAAPLYTVDFAHNDYLQLAAELGVFGLAVVVTLAALCLRSAWRAARRSHWEEERWRALGALGGLSALALHSFVDFNLYIPANAMTLAWVAGIAIARSVSTGAARA